MYQLSESPAAYPVIDVTAWPVVDQEAVGGEEKYWLAEPSSDVDWLFKPNNAHQGPQGEWFQHEDISEKVAGELASLFGIPCARIELAVRNGVAGCISRDLKPPRWELQSGQVLLSGIVPNYIPGSEVTNKERKGHSLENIQKVLEKYGRPPDSSWLAGFSAFDTFVGYVTFDAVVANRDRHDENWAVMRPLRGDAEGTLAGSFDHARALGSTLREAAMATALERGIGRWAERGTAWRFENTRPPGPVTLVALACRALAMVRPAVRTFWLERVEALESAAVAPVTARVPGMSDVVGTFIQEVVAINRRRVLDDC